MSEKATQKKATEAAENPAAKAMSELQKMGFGSLAWMGTDWLENMSDLSSELLQFVSERVKEDVKTQHEILHAKDLGEVQKIQMRFMQEAVDQYTAETGKLIDMNNTFVARLQEKANGNKS